jgi:hypothetical protein
MAERETVTPHPNPLPTGEGAHFRCFNIIMIF